MKVISENPLRLLISNDAFYCLYCDEEPLDEENRQEALEVLKQYPQGFEIDDWQPEDDTGQVLVTLIVKVSRPDWPEASLDIMNGWKLIFRIDGAQARVAIWHETKGYRFEDTISIVSICNKPWVEINNSRYPLWGRVEKWAR